MTEEEQRVMVSVPKHLDWHDVGCVKRYGVEGEPCACEKRRAESSAHGVNQRVIREDCETDR